MILKYFETKGLTLLVEELFHLTFSKEDLPFDSTVLPIGIISITYIYNDSQRIVFKEKETPINGLIITGQFKKSYQFLVKEEGSSYGLCLHPTALYKMTQLDVSKITDKHIPLIDFSEDLYTKFNPIFLNYKNDISKLTKKIKNAILELPIYNDATTNQIDKVIEFIHSKEGMLNTYELLNLINFSQKTLETQFKKIVGLTPGKYIRLYRFIKLMRKFEGKEINLKDLIYMYNYYDQSHFAKDFKYFMKQSPKDYFKSEHPFLSEYLNR